MKCDYTVPTALVLCFYYSVSECVDLYSACYYYYYAEFNAPCLGHKEDESQAQWPLYRLVV